MGVEEISAGTREWNLAQLAAQLRDGLVARRRAEAARGPSRELDLPAAARQLVDERAALLGEAL